MQKVYLPPIEIEDTNNLDPQVVTLRAPNTPYLYIDSTIRQEPTANANNILITTSNSNLLINRMRRVAVKKFSLYYYLDNIITGLNDGFTMKFEVSAPDPPQVEIITFTIPSGIYTISQLADKLQILIDAWVVANWPVGPVPTFTVQFVPTTIDGLYGQILISATYLATIPVLAIDPNCTFVTGSKGMLVLTRKNDYTTPTTEVLKLSFFSDVPYRYIDVISYALTKDSKAQSTTNLDTNYMIIYRIDRPHVGYNESNIVEPLNWSNMNLDTSLTQIDFQFLGPDGIPLRNCISRDFNWLCVLSMAR